MKIDINQIGQRLSIYFRQNLDRTIVIIILVIVIINALFSSILFYIVALNHNTSDLRDTDYKEIKIRVKPEVLEKMENREKIDVSMQEKINSLKDPFKND